MLGKEHQNLAPHQEVAADLAARIRVEPVTRTILRPSATMNSFIHMP